MPKRDSHMLYKIYVIIVCLKNNSDKMQNTSAKTRISISQKTQLNEKEEIYDSSHSRIVHANIILYHKKYLPDGS